MPQLISIKDAEAAAKANTEKEFEELVNFINDQLAKGFTRDGLIRIPVTIAEPFLERVKLLFAMSKEWCLVNITPSFIQVKIYNEQQTS